LKQIKKLVKLAIVVLTRVSFLRDCPTGRRAAADLRAIRRAGFADSGSDVWVARPVGSGDVGSG